MPVRPNHSIPLQNWIQFLRLHFSLIRMVFRCHRREVVPEGFRRLEIERKSLVNA